MTTGIDIIALPLATTSLGVGILAMVAPNTFDYSVLPNIITALGGFIVLVGGFIFKIWWDVRTLHKAVNSALERFEARSKQLSEAEATIARLQGKEAGIKTERANPQMPAIIVDETVLTKEKELTEDKKAELKAKSEKAKPKRKRKNNPEKGDAP